MTSQAVPRPNFGLPFVDKDGTLAGWAQVFVQSLWSRTGGSVDKVEAASALAGAAVPRTTEVVAAGGLQAGGALSGNVGLTLYVAAADVADLPRAGNAPGDWAYAANGRKTGEGAGAGTGVPCWWSNNAWCAVDSGAVVAS